MCLCILPGVGRGNGAIQTELPSKVILGSQKDQLGLDLAQQASGKTVLIKYHV